MTEESIAEKPKKISSVCKVCVISLTSFITMFVIGLPTFFGMFCICAGIEDGNFPSFRWIQFDHFAIMVAVLSCTIMFFIWQKNKMPRWQQVLYCITTGLLVLYFFVMTFNAGDFSLSNHAWSIALNTVREAFSVDNTIYVVVGVFVCWLGMQAISMFLKSQIFWLKLFIILLMFCVIALSSILKPWIFVILFLVIMALLFFVKKSAQCRTGKAEKEN